MKACTCASLQAKYFLAELVSEILDLPLRTFFVVVAFLFCFFHITATDKSE